MKTLKFELFADYFQFYLQDEMTDSDFSESWTDETVKRLLAVEPGAIAVGTARNMDVPVTVELHDREPQTDFEFWDQVNECSIEVPSGKIIIAGCTDYLPDAERIELQAGMYRARISYGSLHSLTPDGLDGDDQYRIQLWQASAIDPTVIKWRLLTDIAN